MSNKLHSEEIEIDGELEESIWQDATVFTNFKITQPLSLKQPNYETKVLVTSTKDGIYIGFENFNASSNKPNGKTTKDAEFNTDYNEVIIDFDGSGLRAFAFKVSRSNSIQDSVWVNQNRESLDWDGSWEHGVEIEGNNWFSEFFIPWSVTAMVSSDANQRQIKIYLSSWRQDQNELVSIPDIQQSKPDFLSQLTELTLLSPNVSALDFFPYISLNHDLALNSSDSKVGMDIFWKDQSDQQINLTFNPDFGQVESNELVINLSAIETFFSEKRPFFRENHDLFDLQGPESLRLAHTPRIGAKPDVGDEISTAVDVASRYIKVTKDYDVGFFVASEDDSLEAKGRNFYSARAIFKFEDLNIGYLHTYTERETINRSANVSAIDYQIDYIEDFTITGQFIFSNIDQLGISSDDNGWWITSEWSPSDYLDHELTYFDYGNKLDVSDFGFVQRVNRKQLEYEGTYKWISNVNSIRDFEFGWGFERTKNQLSETLRKQYETSLDLVFENNQSLEFVLEYISPSIDDLITRGNNPVKLPKSYELTIEYGSDQSQSLSYDLIFISGKEFLDQAFYEIELSPTFQISESMSFILDLTYKNSDSLLIWEEDNFLSEYKSEELELSINFDATFGKHEFRLKQEFAVINGKPVAIYEADLSGNLQPQLDTPEAFSETETAIQLRYRYEISPLSEIFIVYSQGGEDEYEDQTVGISRLISKSIKDNDIKNIFLKWKMHY